MQAVVPAAPPKENGVAETVAVGAVVVRLLPNANGVALAVVGFVDDPKLNILLK